MFRRIAAILAIVLLLSTILLGCVNEKKPMETTGQESPTVTDSTQPSKGESEEAATTETITAEEETPEGQVATEKDQEVVPHETASQETIPTETEDWTLPPDMTPFG